MKINTTEKNKNKGSKSSREVGKKTLILSLSITLAVVATAILLVIYFTGGFSKAGKDKFSGVYLTGGEFKYSGSPIKIEVKGAPSDANIVYTYEYNNPATGKTSSGKGNSFVESGIYKVVATLSKKGYEDRSLTTSVKIIRYYTVTFKQDGAEDMVFTVEEGATLGAMSIPTPKAKKGYTVCWSDVSLNNVTKDIVVTAEEYLYTYSVEYWERGGVYSGESNDIISYTINSESWTLANPTRANCIFLGWYDGKGNKVESLPGDRAENLILKAEWLDVSEMNAETKLVLSESGYKVSAYEMEEQEYVPPVAPEYVPPIGPGEGVADTDPSMINSNEDPTETDGTEVNASDKMITGNGEVVLSPDEIDVGGNTTPKTVEVVENGQTVVKTLEEKDAEKYRPQRPDESYLIVCDVYDNKPVVEISENAFENANFTNGYVGINVKTIKSEAFKRCKYLETLYGFKSTEKLENSVFRGTALKTLSLPAAKYLGDHAFAYCDALTALETAELEHIGANCFENCFNLAELSLTENVAYIGENAFKNCNRLTIFYSGTRDSWDALINSFGGKEALGLSAKIKVVCDGESMDEEIHDQEIVDVEIADVIIE